MHTFFASLLMLFSVYTCAQVNTLHKIRLIYKYTCVPDSTKPLQNKTDIMHLDILGDSGSIYYSKDVEEKRKLQLRDEPIITAMINSGTVDASKFKQYSSNGIDDVVIKNYSTKQLVFGTWVGLHYFYTEPFSGQKWKYLTDTLSINGFFCQKAVCEFGDRTYIAWFCKSVNVFDGPWKFFGLPGAIIKIYDSQNYFSYELQDLLKIEGEKIDLNLDTKEFKKNEKKNVVQLMKDYFEDKMATMQRLGGFSVDIANKNKKAPKYYNPQERK